MEGKIVAMCTCRLRTKPGGINHARILVDPVHQEIIPFFIQHVTLKAQNQAPGRRLELITPSWLPDVVEAVKNIGYAQRYEQSSMGLFLEESNTNSDK